jgi:hypothetical protein
MSEQDSDWRRFVERLIRVTSAPAEEQNPTLHHSDSPENAPERPPEGRVVWLDSEEETTPPRSTRRRRRSAADAGPLAEAQPSKIFSKPAPTSPKIDWGGTGDSKQIDLPGLVGVEDAYEHTPLQGGETVMFCQNDQVAYHLSTWQFLLKYNQGRCCACGRSDRMTRLTLPGELLEAPQSPARPAPLRVGEGVIGLDQIHEYIGRATVVQDYVHNVHRSQKGTFFIKFEPLEKAPRPFDGFKVVIFNDLAQNWERAGLSPTMYQQHTIRVRGVIQQHPEWGLEILVNSPRVIQIVDTAEE